MSKVLTVRRGPQVAVKNHCILPVREGLVDFVVVVVAIADRVKVHTDAIRNIRSTASIGGRASYYYHESTSAHSLGSFQWAAASGTVV